MIEDPAAFMRRYAENTDAHRLEATLAMIADDAIYLSHALIRYVPHFIALAASSPYYQGVDTAFDSSRLSVVNAFPLSGTMPLVRSWVEFNRYYDRMVDLGIVKSMKDFYWDIRPKPEYGTVEIRVCDTPLTVDRAAQVAAFAQALARWLWEERPIDVGADIYLTHSYNRFQACRHGFSGTLIDAATGRARPLADDLPAETLNEKVTRCVEIAHSETYVIDSRCQHRFLRVHSSVQEKGPRTFDMLMPASI